MKNYIIPFILLVILAIFYISKKEEDLYSKIYFKTSGLAQGTTYSVIYSTEDSIDLTDSIRKILIRFDHSLSSYIPGSIISRINNNEEGVTTDSLFNFVFNLSKEIYGQTGGAFDITVAPLVNAWGFGWNNEKLPDTETIDSIMEFVGMDKVRLDGNTIHKSDPRLQLDVNAIAQGYSVDIIASFLDKWGITDYLVEVGGEMKGFGRNQNDSLWNIGIERPTENNNMNERPIEVAVRLNNMALATSGNYRKFYEKDGVKYVHTIDPKTGMTIQNNLLSASVLTSNCARADALATAFMVLGFEKSKALIETLENVEAYFIYGDKSGYYSEWSTPGFAKLLKTVKTEN